MTKPIIKNTLFAIVFVAGFFTAQAVISHADVPTIAPIDQALMDCLPDDIGTRSVLSLTQESDGLTLHCEKHQAVGYGQLPNAKPIKLSYLVPVVVD
jgi:hypothetical protein